MFKGWKIMFAHHRRVRHPIVYYGFWGGWKQEPFPTISYTRFMFVLLLSTVGQLYYSMSRLNSNYKNTQKMLMQ